MEELRRVREQQATENNLLCLVTTYNNFQQSGSIPSGQENTSHVERKLLTKIHDMSKTKVIHSQRQPRNLKQM